MFLVPVILKMLLLREKKKILYKLQEKDTDDLGAFS